MNIIIGNDHAGFETKVELKKWLIENNYTVTDAGTNSSESVDYPDFVHKVANAVEKGEYEWGILICGSGQGVSFTANKHQGIRAALCWTPEIASLSRQHNNANILCMPGRFVSNDEAIDILKAFINEKFEGGRHQNRIDKVAITI